MNQIFRLYHNGVLATDWIFQQYSICMQVYGSISVKKKSMELYNCSLTQRWGLVHDFPMLSVWLGFFPWPEFGNHKILGNELDTYLSGYELGIIPSMSEQIDASIVVLIPRQHSTIYANRAFPVWLGNFGCNHIDRVIQPITKRLRDLVNRWSGHILSCKMKADNGN